MPWLYLAIAIAGEIVGTSALKASEGFAKLGFGALAMLGYGVAFYFLALVLKTIPVGVAYAIWSGAGVAAITVIGAVVFGQKIDLYGLLGIGLIVAGVVVLNTMSGSVSH
ncbi:MAG: multidrug efflux SMR transporter [Pseudomonadota bacterium]